MPRTTSGPASRTKKNHTPRPGGGRGKDARGARPPRPSTAPAHDHEVDEAQFKELLLQALETELGGVQVYEAAVSCAVNGDLRKEWSKYLDQTRRHVDIVTELCNERGIDPNEESPGRLVVRHIGESLVQAMRMAQQDGEPAAAELVAAECVVMAEAKDHQNWELLDEVASALPEDEAAPFREAVDEVEDEEDEHLYHTMGWARELWIESLGLPAALPPPEERRDVKSAIAAAKAKKMRKSMAK